MDYSSEHITDKVTDFSLGLLPPEEEAKLLVHISICKKCRNIVNDDRLLMGDVRAAVQSASEHSSTHIRTLMPPVPPKKWDLFSSVTFKPLAFALLVVLFGAAGLLLEMNSVSSTPGTPSHLIATSINSDTPTIRSTAAPQVGQDETTSPQNSLFFVPSAAAPHPEMTPETTALNR